MAEKIRIRSVAGGLVRFSTAMLLFAVAASACAEEFLVSNAADIQSILPELDPGDSVVLAAGFWTDQHIDFAGIGTDVAPITLRAQTPGLVRLNGASTLSVSGDWIVVEGLRFEGGSLSSGSIVQFRGSLGQATNSRFTGSAIVDYNPPDPATRYFWVSMYGQHNRVDNNFFSGHDHSGVTVVVLKNAGTDISHIPDGLIARIGLNGIGEAAC